VPTAGGWRGRSSFLVPVEEYFRLAARHGGGDGSDRAPGCGRLKTKWRLEVEIGDSPDHQDDRAHGVEMLRKRLDRVRRGTTWGAAEGHEARGVGARSNALWQAREHQVRTQVEARGVKC